MKPFTIKYQEIMRSGAKMPFSMGMEGVDIADAIVRFNSWCVANRIDPEILSVEPLKGAELEVWNGRDANGQINTMGD